MCCQFIVVGGVTQPFWGANAQGPFPGIDQGCIQGGLLGARLFFALYLTMGGKVEVCGGDDFLFCSSPGDRQKTRSCWEIPRFSANPSYAPNCRKVFFKKRNAKMMLKKKIKSSLYSPYYAEACNELRGPSPRLSAWATQLRRNVATVASRWQHYVDLTGPGIEPQTSLTDSVRLATELTDALIQKLN